MVSSPATITHRVSVPRPSRKPTTGIAATAKNPAGDMTNQGLQQTRQRGAGSIKHQEGAKDDEAARAEVSLPHWAEIDHGAGVAKLPEDQGDQTHSEKSCQ